MCHLMDQSDFHFFWVTMLDKTEFTGPAIREGSSGGLPVMEKGLP